MSATAFTRSRDMVAEIARTIENRQADVNAANGSDRETALAFFAIADAARHLQKYAVEMAHMYNVEAR